MIDILRRLMLGIFEWLITNPVYVIIAVVVPLLTFSFSTEQPPEITIADSRFWVFVVMAAALGSIIYYVRREYAAGFDYGGQLQIVILIWFIIALVTAIAVLPPIIGSGARLVNIPILECPAPRMIDYTWFVLDNVAKGVLLDFLESFDFDLYDQGCAPIRRNTATSVIKFSIRSFSTYILIWFAVRLWGSVRVRLFGVR